MPSTSQQDLDQAQQSLNLAAQQIGQQAQDHPNQGQVPAAQNVQQANIVNGFCRVLTRCANGIRDFFDPVNPTEELPRIVLTALVYVALLKIHVFQKEILGAMLRFY